MGGPSYERQAELDDEAIKMRVLTICPLRNKKALKIIALIILRAIFVLIITIIKSYKHN
jgi:hypothetical protein